MKEPKERRIFLGRFLEVYRVLAVAEHPMSVKEIHDAVDNGTSERTTIRLVAEMFNAGMLDVEHTRRAGVTAFRYTWVGLDQPVN